MWAPQFQMIFLAALAFVVAGNGAAAQATAEQFYDIPPEESALVIMLGSGWSVTAADEQGSFDEAFAEESPLALQYRVKPGMYQIYLDPLAEPIVWEAEPGSFRLLWFGLFQPPSDEVRLALEKGYVEATEPKRIDPAGDALYLDTEPPWRNPFDEKPDDGSDEK